MPRSHRAKGSTGQPAKSIAGAASSKSKPSPTVASARAERAVENAGAAVGQSSFTAVDGASPVASTTLAKEYARIPTAEELSALASGQHGDPHTVLGAHPLRVTGADQTVFRTLMPEGKTLVLVAKAQGKSGSEVRVPMIGQGRLYQAKLSGEHFDYHFEEILADGSVRRIEDAYRFPPTVSDLDLYLFKEGTLEDTAGMLGAHPRELLGVKGYNFVVWAPNAKAVSVVGDFNGWDPLQHPMRRLGDSVWEIFVPEVKEGEKYKFSILNAEGDRVLKSDPAGQQFELRPNNASITVASPAYPWHDAQWLKARTRADAADAPVSIYEMHLPSWKRGPNGEMLTAHQAADQLVDYVSKLGFTHIELMGLSEYPFDGSWGYEVTGYYAPSARLGSPDDLRYLVDRLHQAGIGVIMDWVPSHFPKDSFALNEFDGTHLFDYADDREGAHLDWGTRIFNYKRPEVRSFLIGSAMHWFDQFHLDGVRVDAVASMLYRDYSRKPGEWIPNENGGNQNLEAIDFLKQFNQTLKKRFPGALTIAEESTAFPGVTAPVDQGGLGFDRKWNMGWMHDTLEFFQTPEEHRGQSLDLLTNTLLWAHSEKFNLALSHDEVVHLKKSMLEKMPGTDEEKFANLRTLYSFMLAYPGQKTLFMGDEFGQKSEWNEAGQLQWGDLKDPKAQGLERLVSKLNQLYKDEPALHQEQFAAEGNQLVLRDTQNAVVAMLRKAKAPADDVLLASNFTPAPHAGYRIGVDLPGTYKQIFSSDAAEFGGSDVGHATPVTADAVPAHGKPYSIAVTLPGLATVAFKHG